MENIEITSPEILFLCFLRLFAAISRFDTESLVARKKLPIPTNFLIIGNIFLDFFPMLVFYVH